MQDELTRDAFGVMTREGTADPVQARPRIMGKGRKRLWTSLAAVAISLAGTGGWYVLTRPTATTGPAIAVVARRDLNAVVTATGTIKAMVGAEVRVGARIPGRVEQLVVQVGIASRLVKQSPGSNRTTSGPRWKRPGPIWRWSRPSWRR